ncbi:hypothetical protein FJZ36_06885 [Candidatus Poribacteria bacterium]|nr:hypothetical protein [Candidatus Poribacteria bacterium]
MSAPPEWKALPSDLEILRSLASRIREISESPVNVERRKLWFDHNDLKTNRPVIMIESHEALQGLVPGSVVQCQEGWARGLEYGFRRSIYHHEHIADDSVVEPFINCNWNVSATGYGVSAEKVRSDVPGVFGAYRWDAPIVDIDRDFDRLKPRTFSVDRESTLRWKAHLEHVFDGILDVRIRGGFWWTVGMTWTAIDFLGIDGLMLAMYDNPAGLHRLMGFLRDDLISFADWLEREELFSLNNENDYIGSGARGYTRELPVNGAANGDAVRAKDLWVLSESQETVGVGPDQFAEFVFPYQHDVVKRFGMCYYGCCEPVHNRWHVLKGFENLRSVSVSPWCDEEFMADALADRYVFSRKPNPTLISTEVWHEDAIRDDLRHTLRVAEKCSLEIVMKDIHTLVGEPERAARWVQIAREVVDEVRG